MSQNKNPFLPEWDASIPRALHGILLLGDRLDGHAGNDPSLDKAEKFIDPCLSAFAMAEDSFANFRIYGGEEVAIKADC